MTRGSTRMPFFAFSVVRNAREPLRLLLALAKTPTALTMSWRSSVIP